MIVIGLTGSIAMGKSTAAAMLARMGLPMHDADAVVHGLLARGGAAVPAIEAAFPGVVVDGAVDRPTLGKIVFDDAKQLKRLESIVHPLVKQVTQRFLARHRRARQPAVVLNVPLLLEGGADHCDVVAVVSAPFFIQRQRVLTRPGMTVAKFRGILARQMADAEKRRRADFVIPTGQGKAVTRRHLARMLDRLGVPHR